MELGSDVSMGSESRKAKTYTFYIFIVFAIGMFFIAVYYLFEALLAFQKGVGEGAKYQLMTGLFGLAVSLYLFLQFWRRMSTFKQTVPLNIITVIECKKCGLKSLRSFVKGDYVFKTVGECRKCNEPLLITGIYAEKAEK